MALKYAQLRLHPGERPRRDGRRGEGAARERGREGILPRHRRGQAQIVPRRASTTSAASAGWRDRSRRMRAAVSRRSFDAPLETTELCDHSTLETRDPAARERICSRACPAQIAHAMTAPGWAQASRRRRSERRSTSRAALAKLPLLRKSALLGLQKETPPFGGFNVTPPGKAKRLFMSPGPIFEPEGQTGDFDARARAVRGRHPRRRRRAQLLLLSPHARRLHARSRRACARLRGDPRRRRQHRGAARRDRAVQADRPMWARRTS